MEQTIDTPPPPVASVSEPPMQLREKQQRDAAQTLTEKGIRVLTRDCHRVTARRRYTKAETPLLKAEANRLAEKMGDRILVWECVGYVDMRSDKKKTKMKEVLDT